jgi:arylsulfatase A-like enzyme
MSKVWNGEEVVNRALAWVKGRDRSRPLLLYMHLMDAHLPYTVEPGDYEAMRRSPSLGPDALIGSDRVAVMQQWEGANVRWPDAEAPRHAVSWRAAYASGIRRLDRIVGRFLGELRGLGRFEDSVVVLASDHGEQLWDRGDWGHGMNLHDEMLRVPLLMRLPGGRDARREQHLIGLIDVMPSLIGLCELRPKGPLALAGRDLSPLLRGSRVRPRTEICSVGVLQRPSVVSIRTLRHKLIWDYPDGKPALYDLLRDAGEVHDIAGRPDSPTAALRQKLADHLERLRARGGYSERGTVTPEMLERLRALGYIR